MKALYFFFFFLSLSLWLILLDINNNNNNHHNNNYIIAIVLMIILFFFFLSLYIGFQFLERNIQVSDWFLFLLCRPNRLMVVVIGWWCCCLEWSWFSSDGECWCSEYKECDCKMVKFSDQWRSIERISVCRVSPSEHFPDMSTTSEAVTSDWSSNHSTWNQTEIRFVLVIFWYW